MKPTKTTGKLSLIVLIALLLTMLLPAAYADADSARSVSSLEELINVINDPSSGSELEFALPDGEYTVPQSDGIAIPDGKTVTVYAKNVTLYHQPVDGTAMFKIPYGSALNLIGIGSDPFTVVNTTPERINAVLAAQTAPEEQYEEQPTEEPFSEAEGELQEEGENAEYGEQPSAEETPAYTPVYNVTNARGIENGGTLNLNKVCFKGFANEDGSDPDRGYALVNTGNAKLLDVTVKNAAGNDATSSLRNEATLEIAEGDTTTQDSYVYAVSGEFYSKERRAAEAAAEQAAAEQVAAEQAIILEGKTKEVAQYASSVEYYVADADNAYAIAQERLNQGAFSSDLESPMNACNVSMNLAEEMAKAAEAIRGEYPDNAEIAASAEKVRTMANYIAGLYDAICNSYADLLEQEAEMPEGTYLVEPPMMVGMGTPSSDTENIVLSGIGATESQQNVDAQGGAHAEEVENTVISTPDSTPTVEYGTSASVPSPTPYNPPMTSTQDTSAKQSIVVTASWTDNNNAASMRPGSTQVSLYMNGGLYMNTTLSAANNWTYTFLNLPIGNSYRVEETNVANYATNYYTNGNTVSIAHTYNGPQPNTAAYNQNGYTYNNTANGTAGAYSGTQTSTYGNNTQQTAQTAQQTGSQNTMNNVSVTPGPSSTPRPTPTPVPAYASPTPSAAPTALPAAAATELPETTSRSASRGWIWIVLLLVSAAAIVGVVVYLLKIKKQHEMEARARARARRKAQMEAQQNGGRTSSGAYMAQQARASSSSRPNYPGQTSSANGTASRPRSYSSSASLEDYAMSDGKVIRARTAERPRAASARPSENEFRSGLRNTERAGYTTDLRTQNEVADAVRRTKAEQRENRKF